MEHSNCPNIWLNELKSNQPLIIAGPCSAETQSQLLNTAHALKDAPISYFRAGVWKPRTRPGNFEGVGELALKWLQQVKQETGLKTATEVAGKKHVELALKHDIDLLWIGARSTVSPFIVQEIADALKGTDKVVLVKNPVNPDLPLWIGAIERLYAANIKHLGVIHRGFSTYKKNNYRNLPEWQIAIDFKNRFPHLPIICDPSHIAGKRSLIKEVAQMALNLNQEGLMIETHINPNKAWSDSEQQITPSALIELLHTLKLRNPSGEKAFTEQLQKLRTQIDVADQQVIDAIANRMAIVNLIGLLKKEHNISVLQRKRWNQILSKMTKLGTEKTLSQNFIAELYKAIHQESISIQEQIYLSK